MTEIFLKGEFSENVQNNKKIIILLCFGFSFWNTWVQQVDDVENMWFYAKLSCFWFSVCLIDKSHNIIYLRNILRQELKICVTVGGHKNAHFTKFAMADKMDPSSKLNKAFSP